MGPTGDQGGAPKICCWLESLYFCELGAHAKFYNPTTTPSGILVSLLRPISALTDGGLSHK